MTNYTHEVNRIFRSVTKSGKPMWKCFTVNGDSFNVFEHELPERNTAALLLAAGYAEFKLMGEGDAQVWNTYPIKVQLVKDGQWWALAAVEPRPKNAVSDENWQPDLAAYRDRAQRRAGLLVDKRYEWRYWDSESTGTGVDDEIVAASIVNTKDEVLFDSIIECAHPTKLLRKGADGKCAAEINGITPALVMSGCPATDALMIMNVHLNARVWVGWNIQFDVELLERECLRYNHPLPFSFGINDAMQIFAEYLGQWDPQYQRFRNVRLSEAARLLDLDPGQTHTAKADALATLEVMRAVAAGKPIVDDVKDGDE